MISRWSILKRKKRKLIELFILISSCLWASLLIASWVISSEKLLVRIKGTSSQIIKLKKMNLDMATPFFENRVDAILTIDEAQQLASLGYELTILQRESDLKGAPIDVFYHTYKETTQVLQEFASSFPHLTRLYQIGKSTRFGYPIWALKISDKPEDEEDEPALLIDGMHHAREPLGNEICLALIKYLLHNYNMDDKVTSWVNNYEIWVIPILNPEGYKYITDNNLSSPWWRKNLRDNNQNGLIDPDYDGVDLNRNYDFNWTYLGSSNPSSWTYQGPFPFSEEETKAKRDLTFNEKFVASISYHSYGEVILYQWSWPDTSARAPDDDVTWKMAMEMARQIPKLTEEGTYDYSRQTAANQSGPWMYGVAGTLEFLIETGTSFIPLGPEINTIVKNNLQGLFYLFDRLQGPGIRGKVLDWQTHLPVEAVVNVVEKDDFRYISPRRTNPLTGRFIRLLEPGNYTLKVSAPGYQTNWRPIQINDKMESTTVYLIPLEGVQPRFIDPGHLHKSGQKR